MTNSIDELEHTNLILAIGTNTTENHPIVGMKVKRAVRAYGAKLIVIDPRRITLTHYADLWLRQKPGTDVALINGLMHVIIEEDLYDKDYVAQRTEGFAALKEAVRKYTPEYVEVITGVQAEDLKTAARMYARAEKAAILYCMGITQHISGTDNVKSIANLAMLCGKVGIEGGGVNPLRGQNNVQGACDMGALPDVFPAYQKVTDAEMRAKFSQVWGAELPGKAGMTVTEMMGAAGKGKIKAMYIMGENPMLSDPDLSHVETALRNLDFLVVQDLFLTETAKLAHVVLPSACFAEKEGTFTNTERRVQRVRKAVAAPGEAKPDWEIIAELANRLGYPMSYKGPAEIMAEIAGLAPSYGGMAYERLEKECLQWPCPTEYHPGTKFLHKDRFTRGLGLFHAIEYIPPAELPDEEYPFILTTGRVLYHYHTGTMTRRSSGTVQRYPESLVEINPVDGEKLGIVSGSTVTITSRRGKVQAKAQLTERSPQGAVFMNFHFREAAVNLLTNPALDPIAKIPEYKVCAVKMEAG